MDSNHPTIFIPRPRLVDVVQHMRRFAQEGARDWRVRRTAEQICANVMPGDYASEVLAIYYWACENIRYIPDIHNVEFLKWPIRTLETRAGDCDDLALTLAALLMSVGKRCSFTMVSFSGTPVPSHVFCVVHTPRGPVVLDPVANRNTANMLRRVTGSVTVPVDSGADTFDAGTGALGETYDADEQGRPLVTFSVFNYLTKRFSYFLAPTIPPPSAWFRGPKGGVIPEALAVRLPPGAKPVGEGTVAKGVIATMAPGLGSESLTGRSGGSVWLPLAAGLFLGWGLATYWRA